MIWQLLTWKSNYALQVTRSKRNAVFFLYFFYSHMYIFISLSDPDTLKFQQCRTIKIQDFLTSTPIPMEHINITFSSVFYSNCDVAILTSPVGFERTEIPRIKSAPISASVITNMAPLTDLVSISNVYNLWNTVISALPTTQSISQSLSPSSNSVIKSSMLASSDTSIPKETLIPYISIIRSLVRCILENSSAVFQISQESNVSLDLDLQPHVESIKQCFDLYLAQFDYPTATTCDVKASNLKTCIRFYVLGFYNGLRKWITTKVYFYFIFYHVFINSDSVSGCCWYFRDSYILTTSCFHRWRHLLRN